MLVTVATNIIGYTHTIDGAGPLDGLDCDCRNLCCRRAKIDEPVSEAIMYDNYRKTKELKVGIYVAITSIAKSINTLGIKITLSTT